MKTRKNRNDARKAFKRKRELRKRLQAAVAQPELSEKQQIEAVLDEMVESGEMIFVRANEDGTKVYRKRPPQ